MTDNAVSAIRATEIEPELRHKAIAAAWSTWQSRHGGKLGPGPAFTDAMDAALAVLSPAFLKRIEALEAENVRLREALKPFSVVGDTIEKLYPDYRDFVQLFMGLDHGDFRRARAALTQGGQTDD